MTVFSIRPVSSTPAQLTMLCNLLIETVASGGSVSFLHPLEPADAENFWRDVLESADQGERIILGAYDGERLAGTVSLVLVQTPNQPHRAEISKLMTSVDYRGQGVATLLMQAAEALARDHKRTHLVLDTASDSNAVSLYEKLGFLRAGEIPDFALNPFGELTGTIIFWKNLN
ncbi:GNAT family N-acetyltransferase [Bacillus subtilis]|uniref:GNAT family N-acetyltransferase n=1 Tax=Pseudochrobactrum asaccharolyticum TaxID=354351 RepID=UPI001F3CA639|nr:GNAT family N-acetyltransferase [Pseudochrobactrum asaccharolyticum]MCF7644923.1 GNAT family N-acetyltransferase [Pseudochrobactrum asaccharolyticum]MCF7671649.1 GNAT family N-acetyltransferase [Bacillus subtilis]